MKICYICSRYADPDIRNRRRNLAEARAIALWAEAQGYAVVTWWGSLSQSDPLFDGDPEIRRAVLARSGALAAMVGRVGGVCIVPDWYSMTDGMRQDLMAYGHQAYTYMIDTSPTWSEVEPYYTAPDHLRDATKKVQS